MNRHFLMPLHRSRCRRVIRVGGLVWLLALSPLAGQTAAEKTAPASQPDAGTVSGIGEVVTLPPYELDAVEPPWARDTRTALTATVRPETETGSTMVDALRGLPGVHIDQPGGPGGRSSLYLRGGEENYTIVLLDGVPVNNPTDSRGGGFDFGTLDAGEFATVEVVPGPVSARYGPDALSGVIKLTSDVLGAGDASRITAEAGGRGLAAAQVLTTTHQDKSTAALSANWSEDGSRADGNYAR
ncbi:MAG: TonB-dependent receptor plug domain-containing protein, partial [Opitutaceae bacterium]